MSLLEIVHPQPDFPKVDLSETNADFFSLALANPDILHSGHIVAETAYPLFPATHGSLAVAAEHLFNDPDNVRAIELGIRTLEVISLYVLSSPLEPDHETLRHNVIGIVKPSNTYGTQAYFERVHAEFLEETPRTASVIAESSARFIGARASLAVVGGAVARQFGLDNARD